MLLLSPLRPVVVVAAAAAADAQIPACSGPRIVLACPVHMPKLQRRSMVSCKEENEQFGDKSVVESVCLAFSFVSFLPPPCLPKIWPALHLEFHLENLLHGLVELVVGEAELNSIQGCGNDHLHAVVGAQFA